MKTTLSFLIVFTILISCDKEKSYRIKGSYEGKFFRSVNGVRTLESDIILTFEANKFSGSGTNNQSPAICRGTFSTTENEIEFVNGCMFATNFDFTLVLSGKFVISENAFEIILSKEIDPNNGDYYVLDKTAVAR